MSTTRDILIKSPGAIEHATSAINAAIRPNVPLVVRTVNSTHGSWQIAEGRIGPYPIVLMGTTRLDLSDITTEKFEWNLEVHCRTKPGETDASFLARTDADARTIMEQIGASLRSRCIALRDLQTVLGEYP